MKFQLTILFLLFTPLIFAQINYVPNPSFEDTISCPNFYSDIDKCAEWFSCGPTPDYYNSCSTNWVGVPVNFNGHQQALSGNAYCGIYTSLPNFPNAREIIGAQLISPLVPGTRYFASINISLGDSFLLASNNFGIGFSTYSLANNTSAFIAGFLLPKIYSSSVVTNYNNWVNISGSFIADSAYQFILIGNFICDSLMTIINSPSPGAFYGGAYYYVDDVCVSTDSLACPTTDIYENNIDKTFSVFPNPAINKLTIVLTSPFKYFFDIYNVFGMKIFSTQLDNISKTIDLTGIESGVYVFSIVNNKGDIIKTDKLIIIK